ncbi:hypothetical protein D3Y59_06835 [Hymenobacter oligotrophus]|uniref:Uncharacterized protein n=2 Tax=Hymenobacter oligotrophus TaxID=2319843 RepID=A0A3B7RRM0_9BACT|nr:hypothetical protein D3Y59_06835 [Hymenobacter oligotrophus]
MLGGILCLGARAKANWPQPGEAQPVHVEQVSAGVYVVRVSNPAQQTGRLQLVRLPDGVVLYESSSRKPAFGSKLNLQELPNGNYALVVQLGKEQRRYPMQISSTEQRQIALDLASTLQ